MRLSFPLPHDDWPLTPARFLFDRQRRDVRDEDGIVTAFRDGEVTLRANRRTDGFTNAVAEHGYQGIRRGDLVVHSMDAFAGAIGVSDSDGKASPVVHAYRPAMGVEPRYYAYMLRSLARTGFIESLARGIRERSTAFDGATFSALRLPQPSLSAQRAIAEFLDTETARLDALVTKKHRLGQLLEQRFRDKVRRVMFQLNAEHGTVPLKRLVQCLDGRRVPVSSTERAARKGPYPYYGASGVVDSIDDYIFDEELVLLGEDGAQLLDPEYRVAFIVRGKCWVNNHAHVLRPRGADADFLALHLATVDRVSFLSGATRPKLTQDDMGRIPVPNCDAATQRATAARLRRDESRVQELTQRIKAQLALLREHRQALITAAVTGELDVPGVAT